MMGWAIGYGMVGCLYDYQERGYDSPTEAAQAAADLYELTEAERAELARSHIVEPDRDPERGFSGLHRVELFEADDTED